MRDGDHTETRQPFWLNFSSGQQEATTVRLLYTRPEMPCLAFLACVMYMNFTKTFPTLGGAYPQPMSGRGIMTLSMGPYFLHSSATSHSRSSTRSSSQRSSGQHMLSSCTTRLGILQVASLRRVSWMSWWVMFSQESRQEPKTWLAGRPTISCSPVMLVALGVKPRLSPLLPRLAEWHFSFLSPSGIPFSPFIAFSPHACSSYSRKQQPFDTPPSRTRLKNFSLPKVSQILRTCSSLKASGKPPKQSLLSVPMDLRSFFLRYFSWRKSLGLTILSVFSLQLNSGWVRKKSLTLREESVRMAKVLALSKSTSRMGSGMASSGFEAAITVLKYWKTSSMVMVKGRLLHTSRSGWFSAIEYFVFSSAERSATWCSSDARANSLILSSSISLGRSRSLFFFFFFFFSRSMSVPDSSFWMTDSLTSFVTQCASCSISSYNYIIIPPRQYRITGSQRR